LDEKEVEELNIRLNKNVGEWDFDTLGNEFETSDLLEWGFTEFQLGINDPNDPNEEWKGMPEFESEDKMGVKQIIVHFKNKDDIDSFSQLVEQNITEKTRWIWYPKQEEDKVKRLGIAYNDES
jgi:hypothetical protein